MFLTVTNEVGHKLRLNSEQIVYYKPITTNNVEKTRIYIKNSSMDIKELSIDLDKFLTPYIVDAQNIYGGIYNADND